MGQRTWLANIRKGKTTYEMAKELGIPQTSYWKYENGKRDPSVKTAKKMAKKLGIVWHKFFEDTEEGM